MRRDSLEAPLHIVSVSVCLCAGDEDLELGGEEALDSQNLSKRDIHTLNEQRRRDLIKVHSRHGATDPSHGATDPSHGATDSSHVARDPSHVPRRLPGYIVAVGGEGGEGVVSNWVSPSPLLPPSL